MGKRNQVTADLRINAEAQLKNSKSFISQLEKMTDKFDFGEKINNQILSAQEQLKGFNKVLEKLQGKSVISDDELKNLVKAGKEIASLITKTEKLYSGMSTAELQKYSKAYIAQVKAQEEAALKIKQEYQAKTGKVYDKEIKNLDKYENKIIDLQKQIKALNDSKDDTIDAAIKKENARLQEQFDLLQKIKKTQAELKNSKDSIYADSSASTGFSEKELKSKVNTNRADVAKDIANSEYKNLLNIYQAISKEKDEILKSTTDTLAIEQALIQLATQYGLANVKTTEEFNEQLAALEKQKNFYRLLQNRGQLATEEKVTAEIERRNALLREQQRIAQAIADAQGDILVDNGFDSTKQMNSQARNAKEILNGKNVQLTVDGASLTEGGEDDIATQISNSIRQNVDRLVGEEKQTRGQLDDLNETNDKLATQSERAADEEDIKSLNSGVDSNLEQTEKTVNSFTNKDNTRIADQIIQLGIGSKLPYGEEITKQATNLGMDLDEKDIDILYDTINLFNAFNDKLEEEMDSLKIGQGNIDELNKTLNKTVEYFDALDSAMDDDFDKRWREVTSMPAGEDRDIAAELLGKEQTQWKKWKQHLYATRDNIDVVINGAGKASTALTNMGDAALLTSEGLSKSATQTQLMGNVWDDLKNKIGYFLSLNYVFDQVTRKITEATNATKEMDKDMTQIGLVLGKTSGQVWQSFDSYANMAERLSTTTSQVANSMKLFYQQGLNTAEVNKMVEASAIAAALGESTMAEASETLTSILNSYSLSANDALTVTDKISQIAIVSAADFGELSTAIEKVASSAASAGLDLDHMMGYLAKMIETTREAPTNIGTALKTIVANFTQFKEDPTGLSEEGTEINKVDKALKSVGISLTNTNGEVRDLGEVIDELGGKWEHLDRSQRAYLATAIAGTRQQSRFYALMNDYERTLELVAEGSNSAGKSQKQFALYQNSLEAATNRLTNQWQVFFNEITQGNGVLVKLYNFLSSILGVLTDLGPLLTTGGLIAFTTQARKALNIVENIKQLSGKVGEKGELFTGLKHLSTTTNKKGKAKISKKGVAKNQNSIYEMLDKNGLGGADINQLADALKLEDLSKQIQKVNLDIAKTSGMLDRVKLSGTKLKLTLSKGFTSAKIAVKAFGKALATAMAQMAVMWVASKAIEAIGSLIDVATTNAEDFAEAAEKASENASTIQGLRDEYAELANTIDRTAEQEERMNEITREAAEVSGELSGALVNNVSAFKDNVEIMDQYIARQKEIAGLNKINAATATAKENNGWWDNVLRWWNSSAGDGKKEETDTGVAKTLYGEVDAGATEQYNLDGTRQGILSSYAAELMQDLEIRNSTTADWYNSLEEYTNKITAMASTLAGMDSIALKAYTGLQTDMADKSLSYSELQTKINEANVDETIKKGYQDSLTTARFGSVQTVQDRAGLDYGTAYDIVDNLSREALAQIFNPENLDMLSETEQKQYWDAINTIFNDDKLRKQLYDAVEKDGINGLQSFINNLDSSGVAALDIVQDTIAGLKTLSEQVEKAKTAFEKLSALLSSQILSGDFSQLDLIEGLANGTYNIQDVYSVGNSDLLGLDLDTIISQTEARFAELKGPFQAQVKTLEEQIEYYGAYGDNLVADAQAKLELQQKEVDAAQADYTAAVQKTATDNANLDAEQQSVDAALDSMKPLNWIPVAGQLMYLGGMIGHNGQSNQIEAERNQKNAENSTNESSKLQVLNEQVAIYDEINAELQQAQQIRDLINMTEEEIVAKSKEGVETWIAQNGETDKWVSVLNEAGEEIGKVNSDVFQEHLFIDGDKAKGMTEEAVKGIREGAHGDLGQIKLYEDEAQVLRETKKAVEDYANAQVDAAKDIKKGYDKTLNAIEKIQEKTVGYQKRFTAVFESFASAGQVYGELEKVADAYALCDKGASGYFDVAQAIAKDPSLIEALDLESQYLELDRQKVIELGKTKVQSQIDELQTKLEGTNAIIGLIEAQIQAGNAQTVAEAQNLDDKADIIASAAAYNEDLSKSTEETVETEGENLEISVTNWTNWQDAILRIMQRVEDERAALAQRIASGETVVGSTASATLKGISVDYTAQKGKSADEIEKTDKEQYDSILDTIKSADTGKLQSMLESYKKQRTILEKSIGSLKKYQSEMGKNLGDIAGVSDGGGGEDEYEGMIEKLEHFYNYLRQIEALEAKINKIREKRNLIDATQNYYIDDLMQENELLKEQAALYGNYINDEIEYLAVLRNQLASAYGDWVYFNDEGVVQVKQTEFAINSEEEEERYQAFSELLGEYQNEYNTMLENQNTLYTIQATIVENINNSYDKILQKLTDVSERLEYINSISEHWVNMEFGSIDKLPLLNNQIKTTADMLLNAQKGVNELEGDFAALSKTIEGSGLSSLLIWDEGLQKYLVNNELMNDPKVKEQFESQGYNWEEIVTWVNAVAGASQKITDSMQEVNTQLMSAREQLKDLLEERISTISEIFEKATEEINKFYGIYEKKIDALGTENDLFGTKSENIDAQYDYLMTVAGHSKALLESLKKNNQDILNTLTTDYADYVDMIDGVAYINKMAIEESDTLTEAQKADLLQLYQLYYESQDQIEEVNDKFYDYISQIEELERAKRDAIIDLKNQLHDELMAKDQEEIDELSEKYDKMSALDDEYYSQLQQRISDARNARSRLQDQQDLAQMQNRLSVLQRDNSGQYNSELVELQKQINERLQAQADQNIDLEMERIAREQQQREEDRQMQITQMENLLTFKDENGIYWQETQDIINNGTASVLGILMSTKASEDQSNEARKQQLEDLQDQAEMANAGLSTQRGYLAADFRQALQDYVNTPLADLDIPGIALDNANTIANEIAHGTQVFINTMSGLFRLLNEANGKTEAGGYTTGLIDPETGVYTPPTKNPPKPQPAPAPAPTTPSTSSKAVAVGGRVKANSSAKIYNSSSGSAGGNQYYSKDPIYTVLKILGNRALVRHHKLSSGYTGWFNLSDLTAYKKGGYVNFTGPAWVDGSNTRPEAFLNAKQTALFETLRDALVRVPNINSKDTDNSENITIENLTIDVKELADTDSVDKIVRTVKQSIYKDATSGNNMKINRR